MPSKWFFSQIGGQQNEFVVVVEWKVAFLTTAAIFWLDKPITFAVGDWTSIAKVNFLWKKGHSSK